MALPLYVLQRIHTPEQDICGPVKGSDIHHKLVEYLIDLVNSKNADTLYTENKIRELIHAWEVDIVQPIPTTNHQLRFGFLVRTRKPHLLDPG